MFKFSFLLSLTLTPLLLGSALCSSSAKAITGFTSEYAPGNWSTLNINTNGGVNASGAPNSIEIVSGNNLSHAPGSSTFTTIAAGSGIVSYDWNFNTSDSPSWESLFSILNGRGAQLSSNPYLTSQAGTYSFNVNTGEFLVLKAIHLTTTTAQVL